MLKFRVESFRYSEYLKITFGVLLLALGMDLFLIPNKIAAGGVSGIGVILFHLWGLPVGGSVFFMNLILFLVAFKVLGGGYGLKSIFAVILFAVFVDFFHYIIPIDAFTNDLLIASIFGNLLTGIGLAIVFNQDSSTGGTDILARLVNRYTAIDLGKALLIFDFIIAASAGVALQSIQVSMYSLLSVLINTFTIDAFIGTVNSKKSVMIISRYPDEIVRGILHDLGRGATVLHATGAFSGEDRRIVLTIVNRRQMVRVRNIVREIDSEGFVIIGTVNEVLGEGFRRNVA